MYHLGSMSPVCKEVSAAAQVCNLHDLSAPRIYILEHTDGAGHRMQLVPERVRLFLRYACELLVISRDV